MRPKRPAKPASPPPASPLDVKRRALAEQQAKLEAEIAKKQRLIEEAPKIAKEQERQRRNEIIARASRTEGRLGTRGLQDQRYAYQATVIAPTRRLKSERRQGMLTFFVLCMVLAAVLAWLYYTVFRAV